MIPAASGTKPRGAQRSATFALLFVGTGATHSRADVQIVLAVFLLILHAAVSTIH
jgi:hypothetical protein